MNYNSNLLKLAGAYYTDVRGVIFAILRASGVNHAAAYLHAYHNTTNEEQNKTNAKKLEENEYMKQLIFALKAAKKVPIVLGDDNNKTNAHTQENNALGQNIPTSENNNTTNKGENSENIKNNIIVGREKFNNVEDVRRALSVVAGDVDGKDRAQVLVQLAKMLPEEEKPANEQIKLYLPFNSDCRQCVLYQRERENSEK